MKALVLLSGGLDSAVALAYAIDEGFETEALFFDYGQQNLRKERVAARSLCKHYGCPLIEEKLRLNALQDPRSSLINGSSSDAYLPCRNLIFLSIATAYAELQEIPEIWLGLVLVDETSYPDGREEFARAFELCAMLGSKNSVKVQTPLIDMDKPGVIRLAQKLKVPWEKTRSCISSQNKPCLKCRPCEDRLLATKKLHLLG